MSSKIHPKVKKLLKKLKIRLTYEESREIPYATMVHSINPRIIVNPKLEDHKLLNIIILHEITHILHTRLNKENYAIPCSPDGSENSDLVELLGDFGAMILAQSLGIKIPSDFIGNGTSLYTRKFLT